MKIADLKARITFENYAFIALTETWCNEAVSDRELELDGYNLIRKDRTSRGGGVILYIKNDIPFLVLDSNRDRRHMV